MKRFRNRQRHVHSISWQRFNPGLGRFRSRLQFVCMKWFKSNTQNNWFSLWSDSFKGRAVFWGGFVGFFGSVETRKMSRSQNGT